MIKKKKNMGLQSAGPISAERLEQMLYGSALPEINRTRANANTAPSPGALEALSHMEKATKVSVTEADPMIKRERDIEDMVERSRLEILNFQKTGAHYQLTLRAPNGETRRFAFAKTPSDVRGDANQEADLKRWARENQPTDIAVNTKTARDPGMPKTTPSETKAKPMTAAISNPSFGHIEFYKTCEWLKAQKFEDQPMTSAQLAIVASTALKFTVPEKEIVQCLEVVGVRLLPPSIKMADAIRHLSRELHALAKELGREPSKELCAMVHEGTSIEA